jgi:hypothetical protein
MRYVERNVRRREAQPQHVFLQKALGGCVLGDRWRSMKHKCMDMDTLTVCNGVLAETETNESAACVRGDLDGCVHWRSSYFWIVVCVSSLWC